METLFAFYLTIATGLAFGCAVLVGSFALLTQYYYNTHYKVEGYWFIATILFIAFFFLGLFIPNYQTEEIVTTEIIKTGSFAFITYEDNYIVIHDPENYPDDSLDIIYHSYYNFSKEHLIDEIHVRKD